MNFAFAVFDLAVNSAVVVVGFGSVVDAMAFGALLVLTIGSTVVIVEFDFACDVAFGFAVLFVTIGSGLAVVAFGSGDGAAAIDVPDLDLDLRSVVVAVGFGSVIDSVTFAAAFAVLLVTLGSSLDVVGIIGSAVGAVAVTSTHIIVPLGSVVDAVAVDAVAIEFTVLALAFGSAVVVVGLGSDVDSATIALVVLLVTLGSAVVPVVAVATSSAFPLLVVTFGSAIFVLTFDCADVDDVIVEARSAAKLVAVALAHLQ